MVENSDHIENTKTNYKLPCGVEMLLGLACILPYLETIQRLSKFAQGWDIFICDFIFTLKFVEANLFTMHCDNDKLYIP
jgi:hypothetical protein